MTTPTHDERLAERVMLALLPSDHPERRLLRWFEYWGSCGIYVQDRDLPGFRATPFNEHAPKGSPEALAIVQSLEKRGLITRHPQKGWFLKIPVTAGAEPGL